MAKKGKEKEKRDISEGKAKNENNKKINNFFDDIEELDEDNMQKLNLKPTPITEPIRKKTYIPKKKNRFALQKKTKTDRAENNQNNSSTNNNVNKFKKKINENKNDQKDEELLKNKINEDDFTEPKEEKMLINQENEDRHKFERKKKFNDKDKDKDKNFNKELNDIEKEMENEINNAEEEENIDNTKEEADDNTNQNNTMGDTQSNIPYIIEEQENLIANHMDIIKSEAKLLTEEGNLISKIKGITEDNYTMEEYVPKIEEIIQTKLNYFLELKQKIKEYKTLLG